MSRITAADDRDDHATFIHSELDDFGLDPYAFRVYAHLARRVNKGRSTHYASVSTTAQVCGMSERRVRTALRTLEEHRLVVRTERPGETSEYRLTPLRSWRKRTPSVTSEEGTPRHHVPPSPEPTDGNAAPDVESEPTPAPRAAPTPAPGAAPPRHDMPPTPAPGAAKGYPSKGIPNQRPTPLPPKGGRDRFDPLQVDLPETVSPEAWAEYVAHRREKRNALKPTGTKKLLALLERHPRDAVAMLRRSVENGWTGVFPLDDRKTAPRRPAEDFNPSKYEATSASDLLDAAKGRN